MDFAVLTEQAKSGDRQSQCRLGAAYLSGRDGLERDVEQGKEWLKKAATSGSAYAYYVLGWFYVENTDEDGDKGVKLIEHAATGGLHEASAYLAKIYYEGAFVPKDMAESNKWLEFAASQNRPNCLFQVGMRYYKGDHKPKDIAKAFEYIKRSAELGDEDGEINLALMYAKGEGVQQNFKECEKWLLKAASQGHTEAEYRLGIFYVNSKGHEGIARDLNKAKYWLNKAASKNHHLARENLAKIDKATNWVAWLVMILVGGGIIAALAA